MLTERERIAKLEAEVLELRGAVRVAGAWPVLVMQQALDQMVDEQWLPAGIRTEIFGRIRKEISALRIGNEELAAGADRAVPQYRTKREAVEERELIRSFQREVRETLRLRTPKPEPDQVPGSPPAEPEHG